MEKFKIKRLFLSQAIEEANDMRRFLASCGYTINKVEQTSEKAFEVIIIHAGKKK